MTAMVEYQIRSENTSMDAWLDEWQKRAVGAEEDEPETTAYAAAINLEDETNVLVFERYAHGETSLQQHMDHPSHATLSETMGERRMTRRRVMSSRYFDVPDFGWWSRPETDATAQGVILIVMGFRFSDESARASYVELTTRHAEYCWANEPDTLIYSGGIATQDADRELDLLKGDLVFIVACSNMAAVDKHANDPRHLALGIDRQPKFRRTYQSAGRGFMWRADR